MANRVDALVMGWKVRLSGEASRALECCHDEHMAAAGKRPVEVGGLLWSVSPSRQPGRYSLERGEVRGMYDSAAVEGWTLELIARSTYLATTPLHQVVEELGEMAAAWGDVEARRLRRFDMAADFSGWRLYAHDPERLVKTRCRTARVGSFQPDRVADGEHAQSRTYRAAATRITGHVVAPGNPVMMRCYDKVAELRIMQNQAKRDVETGVWSEAGWTGADRLRKNQAGNVSLADLEPQDGITRLEFQLRGPVLDELKLRDPERLCEALQPTWNALVGVGDAVKASDKRSGWIRLRGKTRDLDPRWRAVRALDWTGPATIAQRVVMRNAVPFRAAHGNVLSFLAGRLSLPLPTERETYQVDCLPRAERERLIREAVEPLAAAYVEAAVRELMEDINGTSYALLRPYEVAARFAEGPAPGPEPEPEPPRQPARSSVCGRGRKRKLASP